MKRPVRLVLAVYVLCFSAGALNHARDFLERGWRPYRFAPTLVEPFWTALIVLDLAVAALILAGRRRTGLVLAALVMIADVLVNSYVAFGLGWSFGPALPLQSLFLGFVLGSMPLAWRPGLAPHAVGPIAPP